MMEITFYNEIDALLFKTLVKMVTNTEHYFYRVEFANKK